MIVYIAWCYAGCPPQVFSTREKAEAYVEEIRQRCHHFDVAELEVK